MSIRFPRKFAICDDVAASVAKVVKEGFRIRWTLDGAGLAQWHELDNLISNIALSEEPDIISWELDSSGRYTVNSMYKRLVQGATVAPLQEIWKVRVPLKIRILRGN